jgi:hypothetical protein
MLESKHTPSLKMDQHYNLEATVTLTRSPKQSE